jgi:hypothetical protein
MHEFDERELFLHTADLTRMNSIVYSTQVTFAGNMFPRLVFCIFKQDSVQRGLNAYTDVQGWANLDQASKHLEVFRFRDLSPTPKP